MSVEISITLIFLPAPIPYRKYNSPFYVKHTQTRINVIQSVIDMTCVKRLIDNWFCYQK